jgi:DNA polymerase-3 subunit alpha
MTSSAAFVHLRLHSEYSICDSIVRIDAAVERAAWESMPALALTDLGNVFGMLKFYQAARRAGIKPIIGADLWMHNDAEPGKPSRLLLLCRNESGYLRLCELLTTAYREHLVQGRAELHKRDLAGDNSGLIALSGAQAGDIGAALAAGNEPVAARLARELANLFPGAFYLELQRAGHAGAEAYVDAAVALARQQGLPLVATHPIQFIDATEYKAHEARVCIAEGYVLADQRRPRRFTERQFFTSAAEMVELFADLPEAVHNTVEIAKRCNQSFRLGRTSLPNFPTPQGVSLEQALGEQARLGVQRRLAQLFPDGATRATKAPEYAVRVEAEIAMILRMGFAGYFLIVADFINWARQNGVPVGPGRGSGAGSLVAYALGITDLDPLRYDLLFERFLNPERVSMPDFDIDFCQDGRDRVIDYVRQKYGSACVSQISTFGTMAAKAVIRDVGRVLDLPYSFCDQLAKLVPAELGMTLSKAREVEPLLNQRAAQEDEVHELLDLAEHLEGLTRNVGMHAGGVLIAPGKLTDFCPLYRAQGSDNYVSQLDKDDVEAIGLVKFDFLGLRTLTILDWTVRNIRAMGAEYETFDVGGVPFDDRATYQLFASGNTTAVFQSESRSAKDLERRLRADTFEEIIALMALNRPGPLQSGMVDDFIKRKHGDQKVEFFHPALEPVLRPTFGVIVYQEQVMQIAQVLAGYSLGAADLLRRAMGKKKAEEMAKHRSTFVAGATERGVARSKAEHLFDLMEKFAEYGFNKSHSAAYAVVAYQTAYLKAHFPSAFLAATLSAEMTDTDKVHLFYVDARANGLSFLPPDVNNSGYRFIPVDRGVIRFGLGAIKGTGQAAIDAIVAERDRHGPFRSLFDFCARIDRRLVNRRVIEALVRAGAFDSLGGDRASLLATAGVALDWAERTARDAGQVSLFDTASGVTTAPPLLVAAAWGEQQRLVEEKSALGFYLSGHPFALYRDKLAPFQRLQLADLSSAGREPVTVAGIIVGLRTQMTRRGKMLVVTLDDGSAAADATLFSEQLDAHRDKLKEDRLLIVIARVLKDDFSGGYKLNPTELLELADLRTRNARAVRLTVNGQADAQRLADLLRPYRGGGCPVEIHYARSDAACALRLGEDWRVRLDDRLLDGLQGWLSRDNVVIQY